MECHRHYCKYMRHRTEELTTSLFHKLLLFLSDNESMITAGHVIDNLGKIANTKPSLRDTITKKLLDLENSSRNNECKNILLGKAIMAFGQYYESNENKEGVRVFVERQTSQLASCYE